MRVGSWPQVVFQTFNIMSKRRGPSQGGLVESPMNCGNIGILGWGQGGPSFQEGTGQEAKQERVGSFWKGSLVSLQQQHIWPSLSEMGNPWHFLARGLGGRGRQESSLAKHRDRGGGWLLSSPPEGAAIGREVDEFGGAVTGKTGVSFGAWPHHPYIACASGQGRDTFYCISCTSSQEGAYSR